MVLYIYHLPLFPPLKCYYFSLWVGSIGPYPSMEASWNFYPILFLMEDKELHLCLPTFSIQEGGVSVKNKFCVNVQPYNIHLSAEGVWKYCNWGHVQEQYVQPRVDTRSHTNMHPDTGTNSSSSSNTVCIYTNSSSRVPHSRLNHSFSPFVKAVLM